MNIFSASTAVLSTYFGSEIGTNTYLVQITNKNRFVRIIETMKNNRTLLIAVENSCHDGVTKCTLENIYNECIVIEAMSKN